MDRRECSCKTIEPFSCRCIHVQSIHASICCTLRACCTVLLLLLLQRSVAHHGRQCRHRLPSTRGPLYRPWSWADAHLGSSCRHAEVEKQAETAATLGVPSVHIRSVLFSHPCMTGAICCTAPAPSEEAVEAAFAVSVAAAELPSSYHLCHCLYALLA